MSETTATTPEAPEAAPSAKPYSLYMKAWGALLALTLIMVFIHNPTILIIGILAKVTIIAAVFMHLKDETKDFVFIVAFCIVFFSALLYALMVPDALAM